MQQLQVAEGGVAAPKSSIATRTPHFAQLGNELGIFLEMMQGGGLGQFHDQARRHLASGADIIDKVLQPGRIG
jgi:hypothetical protein